MYRNKKSAFTLIELMVVLAILLTLGGVLLGGSGIIGIFAGGLEERTATIEPIRLYTVPSGSGTSYRCYAKVLRGADDESLDTETTFEITDSVLKGQYRSADLFGKLREGEAYEITYYGIRVGAISQFPNIIKVEPAGGGPKDLNDLYDN